MSWKKPIVTCIQMQQFFNLFVCFHFSLFFFLFSKDILPTTPLGEQLLILPVKISPTNGRNTTNRKVTKNKNKSEYAIRSRKPSSQTFNITTTIAIKNEAFRFLENVMHTNAKTYFLHYFVGIFIVQYVSDCSIIVFSKVIGYNLDCVFKFRKNKHSQQQVVGIYNKKRKNRENSKKKRFML